MSFTIAHIGIPVRAGVVDIEIREPGIVRHVAFGAKQQALVAANGKSQFKEDVVLFVEIDPEGTLRRRKFVMLEPGIAFEPTTGTRAVFRGVALSQNTGMIVYLYEVMPTVSVENAYESARLIS